MTTEKPRDFIEDDFICEHGVRGYCFYCDDEANDPPYDPETDPYLNPPEEEKDSE